MVVKSSNLERTIQCRRSICVYHMYKATTLRGYRANFNYVQSVEWGRKGFVGSAQRLERVKNRLLEVKQPCAVESLEKSCKTIKVASQQRGGRVERMASRVAHPVNSIYFPTAFQRNLLKDPVPGYGSRTQSVSQSVSCWRNTRDSAFKKISLFRPDYATVRARLFSNE